METWQDLDDRLRGQAAKDDMSGSVLLTQAGHTIFHGCYGLADRAAGVPIGPGTRFGLASVTKMFTAVAVADQVPAGRLGLTVGWSTSYRRRHGPPPCTQTSLSPTCSCTRPGSPTTPRKTKRSRPTWPTTCTSLLIITINSAAALLARVGHQHFDWTVMFPSP